MEAGTFVTNLLIFKKMTKGWNWGVVIGSRVVLIKTLIQEICV